MWTFVCAFECWSALFSQQIACCKSRRNKEREKNCLCSRFQISTAVSIVVSECKQLKPFYWRLLAKTQSCLPLRDAAPRGREGGGYIPHNFWKTWVEEHTLLHDRRWRRGEWHGVSGQFSSSSDWIVLVKQFVSFIINLESADIWPPNASVYVVRPPHDNDDVNPLGLCRQWEQEDHWRAAA